MADLLKEKVAIITGGASGIGAATVRTFVSEGAKVVIADVQDERGEALAAELGEVVCYQHTDVTDESQIQAVVRLAVNHFGRLDVLFNNAGVPGPSGSITATTVEDYDLAMNVLVRGVFLGIKHAAPIMQAQRGGSIINTASTAGIEAGHAAHVYTAAKAAVINLTRSAAFELGEDFIRVNAICPGAIPTPFFARAFGVLPDGTDQSLDILKMIFSQAQPIPRAGTPEDIANAALFLASDLSSFVNGHAMVVDGGLTASRGSWKKVQENSERMAKLFSRQI